MNNEQLTEMQTAINVTKLGVAKVVDCVLNISDLGLKELVVNLKDARKAVHDRIEELALIKNNEVIYLLKGDWQCEWQEVTKEQFIRAEKFAGFHSKFGDDCVATSGFNSRSVSGIIEHNPGK